MRWNPTSPLTLLGLVALLAACSSMPHSSDTAVTSRHFGSDKHGQPATLWTLSNGKMQVDVTDHGATLVAVRTPDRAGAIDDVILGFDDVSGYESDGNQSFTSFFILCTAMRAPRNANGTKKNTTINTVSAWRAKNGFFIWWTTRG